MANNNLWAPWRMDYLKSLDSPNPSDSGNVDKPDSDPKPCFLCEYWSHPENDTANLVLWRTECTMVLMNRFPYTAGHLLIAPAGHVADMNSLDQRAMLETMTLCRDAQKILTGTIKPHGFNIGINIGRCGGAGLPGHIHTHVVPRWDGDTNFMSITGNARVISQALEELYGQLKVTARKLDLFR
jgi:ATP adenylyltransferase